MRFHRACQCGHAFESNSRDAVLTAFGKHAATCKFPVADGRGEVSCGTGPTTPLREMGETPAGFIPTGPAGGEASASPANVSPAPGQRWEFLLSDGWQKATIRPDGGLIWSNGCGTISGWNLREVSDRQSNGTARCLDPSPSPIPASPAPSAPSLPSRQTGAGAPWSCTPWCGTFWGNLPLEKPAYWTDETKPVSLRSLWCSALCRDERRPPMDEHGAAAPTGFMVTGIDWGSDGQLAVTMFDERGKAISPPGYVPCPKACGNWMATKLSEHGFENCLRCGGVEPMDWSSGLSDWTPPASAPPPVADAPIEINKQTFNGGVITGEEIRAGDMVAIGPDGRAVKAGAAVQLKKCPHALQLGLCPLCDAARAAEVASEIRARSSAEWTAGVTASLNARAEERAQRPDPLAGLLRDDVELFWVRGA